MDKTNNEALQALTATYTDSEDEGDHSDQDDQSGNLQIKSPVNITMGEVEEQQKQKSVAKLVSYYPDENDMVISDDEGGKESSNYTSAEPTPTEEKQINIVPVEKGDIQLPPEPPGRCSQELQEKITKHYEKVQTTGMDMNLVIQKSKSFRNPSIYEKLIQYCGINELGTNYPASLYDPLRWGKESYYEELAKAQKEEMDKKNKEQKEKTKVEIVMGTAKKSSSNSTATVIKASGVAVSADDKNRKSKWDQVGSASLGPMVGPMLPAAPLTSTITGTKGTVISAFGSLPKKSKTSHS